MGYIADNNAAIYIVSRAVSVVRPGRSPGGSGDLQFGCRTFGASARGVEFVCIVRQRGEPRLLILGHRLAF